MQQNTSGGVATQFINDLDPYGGSPTVPMPLAVEVDTDDAWQDFQDTVAQMDASYSETEFSSLLL